MTVEPVCPSVTISLVCPEVQKSLFREYADIKGEHAFTHSEPKNMQCVYTTGISPREAVVIPSEFLICAFNNSADVLRIMKCKNMLSGGQGLAAHFSN